MLRVRRAAAASTQGLHTAAGRRGTRPPRAQGGGTGGAACPQPPEPTNEHARAGHTTTRRRGQTDARTDADDRRSRSAPTPKGCRSPLPPATPDARPPRLPQPIPPAATDARPPRLPPPQPPSRPSSCDKWGASRPAAPAAAIPQSSIPPYHPQPPASPTIIHHSISSPTAAIGKHKKTAIQSNGCLLSKLNQYHSKSGLPPPPPARTADTWHTTQSPSDMTASPSSLAVILQDAWVSV